MYNQPQYYYPQPDPKTPIRKLFGNPVTLILGVLYAVITITTIIYFSNMAESFGGLGNMLDYYSKSSALESDLGSVLFGALMTIFLTSVLAPLLLTIGYLLVFGLSYSRSSSPAKGGVVLVSGAAASTIGMFAFISIVVILFVKAVEASDNGLNSLNDDEVTLLIQLAVFAFALFFFSIAFCIFTKSICNTCTKNRSYGRAALFFGSISILLSFIYLLLTINLSESLKSVKNDVNRSLITVLALSALGYFVSSVFAFTIASCSKALFEAANTTDPSAPYAPVNPVPQPVSANVTTAEIPSVEDYEPAAVVSSDTPAYCPECGSHISPNQAFCAQCGTPLN